MSLRTCDGCNEKKSTRGFIRKQLLGKKFDNIKEKWVDDTTKEPISEELLYKLEQKHKFRRKTRFCKECMNKYGLKC